MFYCTKNPKFPKKLYFVGIFITLKDNIEFVPFHQAFTNIKNISDYILNLYKELEDKFRDSEIAPQVVVIPLTYDHNLPLKKEYWDGEHETFTSETRTSLFIHLVKNPLFFKLLVTPNRYDEKKDNFEFEVAIPFKINSCEKDAEQFMLHSDYPVNTSASHVALYTPSRPRRYNYKTKKLDYPENRKKLNLSSN